MVEYKSSRKLRKVFLIDNTIRKLLFTHQVFESMSDVPPIVDTVVFTCLLKPNPTPNIDLITLGDSGKINDRLREIESRVWPSIRNINILESNDYKIEVQKNIFTNSENNFIALEPKLNANYIVRIGAQEYAVGKGSPALTKEQIKNRIYHSLVKKDSSYFPFIPCGDIQPYHLRWSKTYLKWGENLHCPRDPNIYSEEHILVSRIFDKKNKKIKACHVESSVDNFFVNNTDSFNILSIVENPPIKIKVLLGILNSKLIGYYLTTYNVNLIRSIYPKINTADLKNVRIPTELSDQIQNRIINLIESISTEKILGKEEKGSYFEKELETLIYKLYNTSYEEACIVEGNTEWMNEEEYGKFKID